MEQSSRNKKRIHITIEDIDQTIKAFKKGKRTLKLKLLEAIRPYYKKNSTIQKLKKIDPEPLIGSVYPAYEKLSEKSKKAQLSKYKRMLSSLKSSVNEKCRELYWKEDSPLRAGNLPLRIGLGKNNIFCFLKLTREEKIQDLEVQMELIKKHMVNWGIDGSDVANINEVQSLRSKMEKELRTVSKKSKKDKKSENELSESDDITAFITEDTNTGFIERTAVNALQEEDMLESLTTADTYFDDASVQNDDSLGEHKKKGSNITSDSVVDLAEQMELLQIQKEQLENLERELKEKEKALQEKEEELEDIKRQLQEEKEQLDQQVEIFNQEQQAGQEDLQKMKDKLDQKQKENKKLEQKIQQQKKQLQNQENQIKREQQDLNALKEELSELRVELEELLASLNLSKSKAVLEELNIDELSNFPEAQYKTEKGEAKIPSIISELTAAQKVEEQMQQQSQSSITDLLAEMLKELLQQIKEKIETLQETLSTSKDGGGEGVAYLAIKIPEKECVVTQIIEGDPSGTIQKLVESFYIDNHQITNRLFARFIDETRYVTVAERRGYGWVYLPQGWVQNDMQTNMHMFRKRTFKQIPQASWRKPYGNDMTYKALFDHPVLQVCYFDAFAYAKWAQRFLPLVEHWEAAAFPGGLLQKFPWGDEHIIENCNCQESQLQQTSPVGEYEKNELGLYDICGNAWDICIAEDNEISDSVYLKGGSWHSKMELSSLSPTIRASKYRYDNLTGFRLVGRPVIKEEDKT